MEFDFLIKRKKESKVQLVSYCKDKEEGINFWSESLKQKKYIVNKKQKENINKIGNLSALFCIHYFVLTSHIFRLVSCYKRLGIYHVVKCNILRK